MKSRPTSRSNTPLPPSKPPPHSPATNPSTPASPGPPTYTRFRNAIRTPASSPAPRMPTNSSPMSTPSARLSPRPPGRGRGPRCRHLRRHGHGQEGPRAARQMDGRRLRHEARGCHGHAQRCPPHQLCRKHPVLPQCLQPTNFERTWKNASYVYRELGTIEPRTSSPSTRSWISPSCNARKERHLPRSNGTKASPPSPRHCSPRPCAKPAHADHPHQLLPNSPNPTKSPELTDGIAIPGKLMILTWMRRWSGSAISPASSQSVIILIEGLCRFEHEEGRVPVQAVKDRSARAPRPSTSACRQF